MAVRAQTVDEIIAKNVQAHGGMEKMKSVQTIRMTGKFEAGSFRAGFMQENKRPDKVREEQIIQGLAAVQAYDGKVGWQVNPFGGRRDAELLSQDDLKGLLIDADIDGPLVEYQQKGHKAELVGHDSVEGTDCYKIKLSLKNGDVRLLFSGHRFFPRTENRNAEQYPGHGSVFRNIFWRLRRSERACTTRSRSKVAQKEIPIA